MGGGGWGVGGGQRLGWTPLVVGRVESFGSVGVGLEVRSVPSGSLRGGGSGFGMA